MGNALSRPRQKARQMDCSLHRKRPHRSSPRHGHCPRHRSRQHHDNRGNFSSSPNPSLMHSDIGPSPNHTKSSITMKVPLGDARWPTPSPRISPSREFRPRRSSDSPRKRCTTPPSYVKPSGFRGSSLDFDHQHMPQAPMPPGWDDRFYAGIVPSIEAEEDDGASLNQRESAFEKLRSTRVHYRQVPPRHKTLIDPGDPYWRGARINIVQTSSESEFEYRLSKQQRFSRWLEDAAAEHLYYDSMFSPVSYHTYRNSNAAILNMC